MYERKPSGLLRTGALLLAVLMVFGNLCLPSGVFAAKAAEIVNYALPVEEDFQDREVGKSDPFSCESPEGANAVATVFENSTGNRMLAVSNKGGTVDGDAALFLKKGSAYYKDPVYLSYWLAADAVEGRFYIPTFSSDSISSFALCKATIFETMLIPNPAPPNLRERDLSIL